MANNAPPVHKKPAPPPQGNWFTNTVKAFNAAVAKTQPHKPASKKSAASTPGAKPPVAGPVKPKTFPKVRGQQPVNETQYRIFLATVEKEKQFKAGKYKYNPNERLAQVVMSPDFKRTYKGDRFLDLDDQMHAERAKGLDGRTGIEKAWDGFKEGWHNTFTGPDELKTERRVLSKERRASLTPKQRKAFDKRNTQIAKKEFDQGEIDAGRMMEPLPPNATKFQRFMAGVKMWWRGMDSVDKFNTVVSLVPFLGEASQLARNLVCLANGEKVTALDWAGCIPVYGTISKGGKVIKTIGELSKIVKIAEYGAKGVKVLDEANEVLKIASTTQKITTAMKRGAPATLAYGGATAIEIDQISKETGLTRGQVVGAIYESIKKSIVSDKGAPVKGTENPIKDGKNIARAVTAVTGNPKAGAAVGTGYVAMRAVDNYTQQPKFRTGAETGSHSSTVPMTAARAESYNSLGQRMGATDVVVGNTGATTLIQGPDGKPVLVVPDVSKMSAKWRPIHDEFVKRVTEAAAEGRDITSMLSGAGKAKVVQQIQTDLEKTPDKPSMNSAAAMVNKAFPEGGGQEGAVKVPAASTSVNNP